MANTGRRVTIDFNSCSLRTCNLTIESAELEDAGYYVCFESSSKATARKAASLVVLGQLYLLLAFLFSLISHSESCMLLVSFLFFFSFL